MRGRSPLLGRLCKYVYVTYIQAERWSHISPYIHHPNHHGYLLIISSYFHLFIGPIFGGKTGCTKHVFTFKTFHKMSQKETGHRNTVLIEIIHLQNLTTDIWHTTSELNVSNFNYISPTVPTNVVSKDCSFGAERFMSLRVMV